MTVVYKTANDKLREIQEANIAKIIQDSVMGATGEVFEACIYDLLETFNTASPTAMLQDLAMRSTHTALQEPEVTIYTYPRYIKTAVLSFNLEAGTVSVKVEGVYDPVYIMLGLIEAIDIIADRKVPKVA